MNDALVSWRGPSSKRNDDEYLDAEHANLLAAIAWARLRLPDAALELVNGLGEYWRGRGLWSLGRDVIDDVLAVAEAGTIEWATAIHHSGRLAARQGDLDVAERRYRESLESLNAPTTTALVERNLTDLGASRRCAARWRKPRTTSKRACDRPTAW